MNDCRITEEILISNSTINEYTIMHTYHSVYGNWCMCVECVANDKLTHKLVSITDVSMRQSHMNIAHCVGGMIYLL